MKRVLILLALVLGCTDEANTVRTLRSVGFTDIQTTGYSMFGCGDDDTFSTGFTAKNTSGDPVSGVVCCGFIGKGCTIRY